MPKKKEEEKKEVIMPEEDEGFLRKVGPWSFILGLVIAGVSALTGSVFWLLGALGLVVGLLNITDKEINTFLIASLTFLVSANALSVTLTKLVDLVPVIREWLTFIDPLLANVTLFVSPGAGIVALKALYKISRD